MDHKEILCGLNSFSLGYERETGSCEHGNEPFGSINDGKFL
jgi:hypothetical protein